MFRLLPVQERKTLEREYRLRLAIVALWCLLVSTALAGAFLAPSHILTNARKSTAEERHAALKKSIAAKEATELERVLDAARRRVALLQNAEADAMLHELLRQIIAGKPAGIAIAGFTIRNAENGKREILIEGTAGDRSSLVAFARMLERKKAFETVDLPVSNLAARSDIAFSLTARVAF